MEIQRKIMARGDRLSDLPESILIHILSMLPDSKEVVRSSVLSTRWWSLWKTVPVSLEIKLYGYSTQKNILYLASTNRELYYWRSSEKIRTFTVSFRSYKKHYVKDVDLWVHFATKDANVEGFTLEFFNFGYPEKYELPQFAYKNTSLRNLVLKNCKLNPFGGVNWSNLVSLAIGSLILTDGSMEKVLSGCPNLECLELSRVYGIHRLKISNVKLRELIIEEYENNNHALWLEIFAPHIQKLQLLGYCSEIRIPQRNVASLVTAVIRLYFDFEDEEQNLENECSYLKELLHSIAHVENLELGPWCIECLSILELKGWQSSPSSRKFLKLSADLEQLDFPGICSFLQSSSDLETLVIDWENHDDEPKDLLSRYTDEDEQSRRFEAHNFNCSLLHLKTIKFVNFFGPLSENEFVLPLLTYLLKNAIVLEKFVITARFERSDFPQDYVEMEQDFLSFPRSSQHTSFAFS